MKRVAHALLPRGARLRMGFDLLSKPSRGEWSMTQQVRTDGQSDGAFTAAISPRGMLQAAFEEPALFTQELRDCCRSWRQD
jgi:hypothetical protein